MKKYDVPYIEYILFDQEDIMTTSGYEIDGVELAKRQLRTHDIAIEDEYKIKVINIQELP